MLRAVASRSRQLVQLSRHASRGFASDAVPRKKSSLPLILALSGGLGGLYYAKQQGLLDGLLGAAPTGAAAKEVKPDYDKVREVIEDLLESNPDYDDGSYGPLLVRLAWHTSGTWDKESKTGGSNGATMRFSPEANWGANAGLHVARDLLEPVKKQFPWISYSDLWTLGGAVAVEAMGGPHIKWRPGRSDIDAANIVVLPDGRLPDGAQGAKHLRDIFYRMGFNDQDIVALSGAHTLGRCHDDRSGWRGPWTFAPTTFSNMFFTELKNNKWTKKKWDGPLQYEDKSGELMMLPTDMALLWDKKFKKYVDLYAADGDKFAEDFADVYARLLELGVPFEERTDPASAKAT